MTNRETESHLLYGRIDLKIEVCPCEATGLNASVREAISRRSHLSYSPESSDSESFETLPSEGSVSESSES